MNSEYLYGTSGALGQTISTNTSQVGTVTVYVGTAPVNLVRNYKEKNGVNAPLKLSSFMDAQSQLGYSNDWESYTLCEAMYAHFSNPQGNIGPIYVINVLDPSLHKKPVNSTQSLDFSSGRCEFQSTNIVLDTLILEGKMEGIDFSVDYNFTKGLVCIESLDPDRILEGNISVSFDEADPAKVNASDIVGGKTASGIYTGIGALALLYQEQNVVANLLVAPGYSDNPDVYEAMLNAASNINGHWNAMSIMDIPLINEDGVEIDTIAQAIKWKKENGYTSEFSKTCWPMAIDSKKRVFHISTLCAVEFMRADSNNNGIPMETCANKKVPIINQYFGKDNKSKGFDQQDGNVATQEGITTVAFYGGRWVIWGDHTSAYSFNWQNADVRSNFDVSIRMMFYILNSYQQEWAPEIDKPMIPRQLADRILNREQEKLDMLVSQGALIGTPQVDFASEDNPNSELIAGNFTWNVPVTPTPPFKSGKMVVAYTEEGFSSYFEEGQA